MREQALLGWGFGPARNPVSVLTAVALGRQRGFPISTRAGKLPSMKCCVLLALALLGLSCTISPVITPDPSGSGSGGSGRYDGCREAARDYCRHVIQASESEMKKCVADSTFECMVGGPR
jgi:hypothetical protein